MSISEHKATIVWRRAIADDFISGKYSREHTWVFDGGITVPASPTPTVVPVPYSNPAFVDPEEAFVAALSSCHMLTYLHLAYRSGFQIASYEDSAVGTMSASKNGAKWIDKVTLVPRIVYDGDVRPTPEDEAQLHRVAHEKCIIANSVKSEIIVLSTQPTPTAPHY